MERECTIDNGSVLDDCYHDGTVLHSHGFTDEANNAKNLASSPALSPVPTESIDIGFSPNSSTGEPAVQSTAPSSSIIGDATSPCSQRNQEQNNHIISPKTISELDPPELGSEVILQPFNYICSLRSKGVREQFVNAINHWLQAPQEVVDKVKMVGATLHNSSLLLDDFQDSSTLRRGKPAAHMIFGPAQAVNSACYCIISVIQNVLTSFNLPCVQDTIETGTLFTLLTDLMMTSATIGHCPSLQKLSTLTGRYFQIRDDYQNLMSADYASQKGFCEDLDEGKYSLPLIYLMRMEPDNLIVQNMISTRRVQGYLKPEQKLIMLQELERAGCLSFTKSVLQDLHQDMWLEIEWLEQGFGSPNPQLRAFWELLRL